MSEKIDWSLYLLARKKAAKRQFGGKLPVLLLAEVDKVIPKEYQGSDADRILYAFVRLLEQSGK